MALFDTKGDQQLLSKIATNDGHGEKSLYFDGWKAYDSNPFHPTRNPKGVIQMGLAENQLSVDLIQEWIRNNPQASICTAEGVSEFGAISIFQDYHGLLSFRQAVAKFMEKVRGGRVKFDPSRVVMSGGATGAQEVISFCLADPGDAFLVPTPYYPGSDRDFCWRTGAKLIPIECKSSNKFQITEDALESAYTNTVNQNIRVKGILATNPSNPLGTTMDKDTLKALVTFANQKNIHLVCDELYGGTVFRKPDFVSVAEILQEDPTCNPNLIHIVSSLSKDLGLPGFRIGIIYSYNDAVVNCARKMSSFGLVSTQTQHLLASLLSNDDFTSNFLATSAARLSEAREIFTTGLKKVGIHCLESNAGLYCWMDLRSMLKSETVDAEMELWKVIIDDVKLNVSPGSSFHCSEPGWFRVCFANMDGETMNVALRRIWTFVAKVNRPAVQTLKIKKSFDSVLRLSLPRRFEDLGLLSPSILSPQSPLVHAQT